MKAPQHYQLATVAGQKLPAVGPPRWLKRTRYPDISQFARIDEHAIEVAQTEHASFRDLMYHLVGSKKFTEFEKARAIFRWMTCKNMYTIQFGSEPRGSPEELIAGFKSRKSTYGRIYEIMANYSGLHCITVSGYAKGVDYRPGVTFSGTSFNHSWNVVNVDGVWQIIDTHWATRYLQSSDRNVPENMVYEYDDYYFFPDPQQFIYSHWPEEKQWQLLDRPSTLQEFEELPLAKSHFFKCGMQFLSHNKGVIKTRGGHIDLELSFSRPTQFTFKLLFGESCVDEYAGTKLNRYVLQQTSDNKVSFHLCSPLQGFYYLTVYSQKISPDSVTVENVFNAACEYKVVCDRLASDAAPYPSASDTNWGPGAPVQQMGLRPSKKDGVVTAYTGKAEIRFDKSRDCRVLAKLHQDGKSDKSLENCVETKDTKSSATINLKLPSAGNYALEVYANDPAKDGNTFTHVCQYMVEYPGAGGSSYKSPTDQPREAYDGSQQRRGAPGSTQQMDDRYQRDRDIDQLTQGLDQMNYRPSQGGDDDFPPPPPPDSMQREYDYGRPGQPQGITVQQSANVAQQPGEAYGRPSQPISVSSKGYQQEPIKSQYAPQAQQAARSNMPGYGQVESAEPATQTTVGLFTIEAAPMRVDSDVPKAPASFQPIPIEHKSHPAPKPAPPPTPAPSQGVDDLRKFQTIDRHAVQVSKTVHDNFRDLVWDLIFSKNMTDDVNKARAIFLWLCTKDLSQMRFDNVEAGSPEEILVNLREGKATYAKIFETLCSYAGLHCVVIPGFAKGADYKPGMKFAGSNAFHAWNAVVINGHWRLIDCHWASRRMIGKKGEENVKYELDEYYFLVDPRQLIYTHFPNDSNWELLENPYTLAEFENLPPVKSLFFKYGLDLLSHKNAVISTRDEIELVIGYAMYRGPGLEFTFSLATEDGEEEVKGVKLTRFGIQEVTDRTVSFRLRVPKQGGYKFVVYARENQPDRQDKMYSAVCEYKIVCESHPSSSVPYPPCSSTSWGLPLDVARKYGISTSQVSSVVTTNQGQAEVRFKIAKHLLFSAKLKSNDYQEADLDSCILHRTVGETAIFSVSVPIKGEYGLEIFVNDPTKDAKTLFHMCQYLIVCTESRVSGIRFPQLPAAYLGPQPGYTDLNLSAVSNKDPLIHNQNGELQIVFSISKQLRVTSNLILTATQQEFPEYILQQGRFKESSLMFVIRLPKPGIYKFQMFAQPLSDSSQSLPGVFNYLINCTNVNGSPLPFPKQFSQWKEGCFLYNPMDGHLGASQPIQDRTPASLFFKMEVPKAEKVAVVVGSDWTQLEPKRGCWEGTVPIDWNHETKASVTANYGSSSTSYSTLLEYQL